MRSLVSVRCHDGPGSWRAAIGHHRLELPSPRHERHHEYFPPCQASQLSLGAPPGTQVRQPLPPAWFSAPGPSIMCRMALAPMTPCFEVGPMFLLHRCSLVALLRRGNQRGEQEKQGLFQRGMTGWDPAPGYLDPPPSASQNSTRRVPGMEPHPCS